MLPLPRLNLIKFPTPSFVNSSLSSTSFTSTTSSRHSYHVEIHCVNQFVLDRPDQTTKNVANGDATKNWNDAIEPIKTVVKVSRN